ncbi:methyl-accepting chemotaxis protein [Nostoc sp. 'Peltigera membranacea cyanobiont' 232]|uniref:methyl-accepting chemotaxis protein n=1 Tax=Nostoc sp. 'Peltigera membranacea cyanobiont' 232 TaxID=2014531 RepID=UPI000B9576A9|nr:methyl-accepting chemotaxis protein [Nostoc sp. 'Peltigera membranacea cyanobiont' 232]OYE06805.1 methyl-accepting chemotaxis protein [Nostoc sp. 'Peltigera membranacea cyanobiont' 232]
MFKNMTLQTRLIGSFLFMGLIVLIMALLGWFTTNELNQYINILATDNIPSVSGIWKINEGQTQIQSAERLLFDPEVTVTERQGAIIQIQDAWKQINEGIKQYEATPLSEQEKKEYALLKEQLDAWKQAHEKLLDIEQQFTQLGVRNPWKKQIELMRQGKDKSSDFAAIQASLELRNRMDSEGTNKEEPLFKITDTQAEKLLKLNESYISDTQKEVEQNVARSIFWISIGIAIGPITAIIFGFVIARQIAFQILGVVRVAEQISTGNLTTQVTADSNSKDEMNRLLTAFQTMTQSLNTLIRQVQHSGIQVTTSATQIAASGKQLEATLTEQVASTNEVAAATKEISATSRELVSAMEQVATISQITTTAANDSQKDIVRMETTMRQLAEATNAIAARLGVISEKANNINTIVVTITKVADQTNLLSLNAAIEAEKAGEYGLGFAVVAREIRRLADQTAVATLDIEQMVKQMQSSVSTGVMEMDKFAAEVGRSIEDVGNINTQVGQIIQQVQDLNPRFEFVNQGMETQSVGAQQISEAMVQLSSTSVQSADSLREINHAIAQLNQVAQGLRQEIARFQVKTEDAIPLIHQLS